jgi:hypothetical protein
MSEDWKKTAFKDALRMLENGPPKSLVARAQPEALDRGATLIADDLTKAIADSDISDPFLNALGMQVHKWDAAPDAEDWTEGTAASTVERRSQVCTLLGMDATGAHALLAKRPIFHDTTIVITAPWDHWYTPECAADHAFYWNLYRDYLLNVRRWEQENVTALTSQVRTS